MPDFQITYTGHISWEGQANGLPAEIKCFQIVETETRAGLVKAIEEYSQSFISISGMAVAKDPAQIIDPTKLNTNRMFVPIHWIVYIDTEVRPIINIPTPEDKDGNPKEPTQ